MAHIAHYPPAPVDIKTADPQVALKSLHQGLQMILSVYTCNQLTGEPISIGRLDYALRKFATPVSETNYEPSQELQDMMDAFWLKICEKANFNKGFFEDHQKWGNLALGGNSGSYPQGASFNQWGQQVVVGGLNPDNTPFHNAITVACLRAGRRMPVNAPCLSLRLHKNTPEFLIHEATKTILSGGAHPVLINDEKVIAGLERSGNYVIKK
jgi:pyruvate-formate lyase